MSDEYRKTIEELRRDLTLSQGKCADLKCHLDMATRAYNEVLKDIDAMKEERDLLKQFADVCAEAVLDDMTDWEQTARHWKELANKAISGGSDERG